MSDSRAMFIKSLETIEEEDADYLSQYSRNKLRNNQRIGQSRPQSQANTITTYDTQNADFLDVNSLAYLNANNNNAGGGSARTSLYKQGATLSGLGGKRVEISKSADKWDRNYYYNDYDPRDPLGLYLVNNPKTARRHRSSRMANCLSWLWCGSSVRFFILALSFLVFASLFANLQLFNLVALYAQQDLLSPFLRHQSAISKPQAFLPPGSVTWNSSDFKKNFDVEIRRTEYLLSESLNGEDATDKNTTVTSAPGVKRTNRSTVGEANEESFLPHQKHLLDGQMFERFIQSLLFSVPGLAIMIGHFPSVLLIRRFGAHKVIFGVLLLSGTVTAFFPFIIGSGDLHIVLARSLLGLSFAPAFAFIGTNAAKWATVGEQLIFILVGFLALQFGPMLSWISAIKLLSILDHHSRVRLFGLHSAITTLLAILWLIFYRDSPQKYNLVNGEELHRILKGKPVLQRNRRPQLDRSLRTMIVRSISAWTCWITAFCYFFALLSIHIFLPIFAHKVLHRSIDITIAVPFALLLFAHLFVHLLGPCFGSTSTWKVRVFNSSAFLLAALIFLGITIVPRDHNYEFRCALLLWLCLLPLGLCSAGFIQSAVVCGRFFMHHIVAHMQIAFGLAYFLSPTLVFVLGSESSIVHWRLLFLSSALVLLLGLTIFVILGRGTATNWADKWANDARGTDSSMMVEFTKITKTPFE